MTLQSPPAPQPRKDWSYDKYFLAQLNKNKKKDDEKINKPLHTN
ncbi:MAG: hypothetical protein PHH11_06365 [Methylomonas sp.]|nr:hypothetical protein [Methylomonas sp.]